MNLRLSLSVPLVWAALIYALTTTPNLVVASETWLNTLLMSGAHFFFFGVQAVLLKLSLYKIRNTSYSTYLSVTLTSFYGALIEFIQLSVPGRSADPVDWLLDTLGAAIFLYLLEQFRN